MNLNPSTMVVVGLFVTVLLFLLAAVQVTGFDSLVGLLLLAAG